MQLQKRKPNRLKNYDYSQNGAYFITICTKDRKPILSHIPVGEGLAPPEHLGLAPPEHLGLAPPEQSENIPTVVKLSPFGECIKEQIENIEKRFDNVIIDNYVIMPNHIHILMRIECNSGGASTQHAGEASTQHAGGANTLHTGEANTLHTGGASPSPTVSDVVCAFKSLATVECKKILPIETLFQRSFYDHIVRNDMDYQNIWQYIDDNPRKWTEDKLYPD